MFSEILLTIVSMTESCITLKTDILQLLSMSGQDDHFDAVVANRLNVLGVSSDDRVRGVGEAIALLEQFYDREVAARGGTISAAALTEIMKRGIDRLVV